MDFEAQRLENLREKQKLLADLNLQSQSTKRTGQKRHSDVIKPEKVHNNKRARLIPSQPSRASARIASAGTKPSYREDKAGKYDYVAPSNATVKNQRRRQATRYLQDGIDDRTPNDARSLVPLADIEAIQAGWTMWKPVEVQPTRDEEGTFHFEDFPDFMPNKSPEEMIKEGVFGGSYFRPLKSKRLGIIVQDDWQELPQEWLENLDIDRYLISTEYNPESNKFKVACGQSIEEWEAAGWIAHDHDVRGWYQWYCRFWMGRRCVDDERQVSRWAKCVGPRGRWRRLLLKKYVQLGVRDVADYGDDDDEEGHSKEVSPVMHQTCFHWAYEVRQRDLDEAWEEFG